MLAEMQIELSAVCGEACIDAASQESLIGLAHYCSRISVIVATIVISFTSYQGLNPMLVLQLAASS